MQDKSAVDCFNMFCGVLLNLQQYTEVHHINVNKVHCARLRDRQLISRFHRALLQSITFISRLNALDFTRLIS